MNINIRYCIKCKQAYDKGTEYEKCPKCRGIEVIKKIEIDEVEWK